MDTKEKGSDSGESDRLYQMLLTGRVIEYWEFTTGFGSREVSGVFDKSSVWGVMGPKAWLEWVQERIGGNLRHRSVHLYKGLSCQRKKKRGSTGVEVRSGEDFLNGRNNVFIGCICLLLWVKKYRKLRSLIWHKSWFLQVGRGVTAELGASGWEFHKVAIETSLRAPLPSSHGGWLILVTCGCRRRSLFPCWLSAGVALSSHVCHPGLLSCGPSGSPLITWQLAERPAGNPLGSAKA